jgi:tRNA G18 (ribose-2'-O)-methylase SpoU
MMAPKKIDSENNSTFRLFLKLTKARGIKKNGLALLSGPKQVREVLQEFPDRCAGILMSPHHELPSESSETDIPSYCLDAGLFRKIDLYETGHPILLVKVDPFPRWEEIPGTSGCTLCVPFQDPANVGAAIRSAAAFGVPRVVFLKEAAHPFHPKSVRVAGSSLFRVSVFEGPSLYGLKHPQTAVITLSPEGEDVKDFRFPASFFLVPGLEGPGLPDHLREATCLSVPMASGVESINAAMATGIVLYVWRCQSIRKQT